MLLIVYLAYFYSGIMTCDIVRVLNSEFSLSAVITLSCAREILKFLVIHFNFVVLMCKHILVVLIN